MISKIIITNSNFEVHNGKDELLSTKPISNKRLLALSPTFYVLIEQQSNLLTVYNFESLFISSMKMDDKMFIKCINSYIYIKNGVFIEAYDENLNKLYISNTTVHTENCNRTR